MKEYKELKTPEELMDYMKDNFEYGYLDKDNNIHHYDDPNYDDLDWFNIYMLESEQDILETNVGTCFDMTELERDFLERNGYTVHTYFEMILLDYNNPYPMHSILVYEKDSKYYYFEFSDYNNRGIYEYSNIIELLNDQIKKYMNKLEEYNIKEEEKGKLIITKFDKVKEHASEEEYLDHVLNSKNIMKTLTK